MWIPVFISAALLLYLFQTNQASNVKLGRHFTLAELTNTNTGLPNAPTPQAVANLQYLVETVLDPLRDEVGPVIVTSGYRSPEVNAAVGGSPTSQHMQGEAADIVPTGASKEQVLQVLRTLPVDQVVTYFDSNHIHISAQPGGRGEFLYKSPTGYEVA